MVTGAMRFSSGPQGTGWPLGRGAGRASRSCCVRPGCSEGFSRKTSIHTITQTKLMAAQTKKDARQP